MSQMIISDTGVFARAELDMQISTAKAYPRNKKDFLKEAIELATMDQETAQSCFYCLFRNGKEGRTEIKGPSIRLAEIAAGCWGNIHAATRIVENDGKFITAEGVAWDLEKNVKMNVEVKRKITGRDGRVFSEDMQVVTGNASCAIALRNAIFKVVPKVLVDRIYDAAVKFSVGDQKTLSSRRAIVFDRFNKLGIDNKKILQFFNKESIEEFNSEDLSSLIGVGTAIKEGMISIDKAFSLEEIDTDDINERLKFLLEQKQDNGGGDI